MGEDLTTKVNNYSHTLLHYVTHSRYYDIADSLTEGISGLKTLILYQFHHGNIENANVGGNVKYCGYEFNYIVHYTALLCVKIYIYIYSIVSFSVKHLNVTNNVRLL
ncbi:hypothetical protein H8356DRAFT_1315689 [Neocallimastix lanati (nom. inval.)]|nr:hypothetical protein H8356DRAFT_1315689 [Neocallimastix sp. JGI-2020a]